MDDATRRLTLRILCSMNVVQCVIGTVLLLLGVVSRSNHGAYSPGVPPYYTGSFICMTTVILQGVLGFIIFYRGKSCVNKNDVAKKIGCWMQMYSFITTINGIGQIAAMLVVGFTGVCTSGHCSYLENRTVNRNLAISTLVFSVIATISSAIGLIIVLIYSSYFGFKMFSRGQYQISSLDDRNVTNIEQTPVVDITSGPTLTTVNTNHSPHHTHDTHAHHSHPDPRPAFPTADFSAHHVSHYLTQQYRERIRKRKKKTKKANKENNSNNGKRNGRQHRSAPYELPPLSTISQRFPQPPTSPRMQPPDSPSPPLESTHFPPPSPPSTPPLVSPSSVPVPTIRTTAPSPPPWSLTPSPPPPPPSPPMDYLGVVHVIPCGEYLDDDSSLYSCF